ncbi:sulfate ABC transporter permease [Ktedonobacteria bacterium brp13]|nr:sulfate ABC transporter permease [Ktedonobacteria bacterium brp13]
MAKASNTLTPSTVPSTGHTVSKINVSVWARRLGFYALLILAWQFLAMLNIWPSYVLPGPLDVLASLVSGILGGQYIPAILVSMQRLLIGYSISLVIGLILGSLLGRFHLLEETVGSLILGLQALPSVCWLPLAIIWFGLDEQAITFVVVMGALFSITIGVLNGIKNTPPIYLKAARTLGSRGLALSTQVILPATMPSVINGMKQGWTFAWRSLMAGELLYTTVSLGNLLETGRDQLDSGQVVSVMLIIIAIGITIDTLVFGNIERSLRERWGLQS